MNANIPEIILIKNGEIALKGNNKASFEELLVKNLRRRLKPLAPFEFQRAQSTIVVTPLEPVDMEEVEARVSKVFGIAGYCRAAVCEKDFSKIVELAKVYLKERLESAKTFKVEAKRSDKKFPMKSPEISAELGAQLLEAFPHLSVDVHQPDLVVRVEVRDFAAYLHTGVVPGAGGMPVSSAGKAALLVSGGIDSPVAAYMMAKRGLSLTAVHFFSPPYTSEQALQKVKDLLSILSAYCGRMPFVVVPFTKIQEAIRDNLPEEYFTLVMRRFMMKITQEIAQVRELDALITGESLGQVASQTLNALACTDAVCQMPVFRPVIGMDKEEIIRIARKIGTFETSIQPFEDCCTVFTPRHPRTKPRVSMLEDLEQKLDVEALCREAIQQSTFEWIG